MAKTRNTRWVCPLCTNGKLAPTRPRKDDVRRYCLPCSEKTGKLVERGAPALEKKREERSTKLADKRKEKAKRDRDRERENLTVAGIHLPTEAERIIRKAKNLKRLRGVQIDFHVRRCTYRPNVFGRAWVYEQRISISDYPGITPEDVAEILTHELCHLVVGGHAGHAKWHGLHFVNAMDEAFEAAYGCHAIGARKNRYHGRYAAGLRKRRAAEAQLDAIGLTAADTNH